MFVANNRWFTMIYLVGAIIAYTILRNNSRIMRERQSRQYGWFDILLNLALCSCSWLMVLGIGVGYLLSRFDEGKYPKPPKWL